MSAIILDGKTLATAIRAKVKERVASLKTAPGLAVLLVGDDPASVLYVGLKQKACEEAGIRFEKLLYSADVSEETLLADIAALNARADIDGILVQLPLPSQSADRVVGAIDPQKDVDGFHPSNIAACADGKPCLVPPVHLGVMKLIEAAGNTSAKTATIVGSQLFAAPLISLLKERGIEAIVVSDSDPELSKKVQRADIVVSAVGKPKLITGRMIKFELSFKRHGLAGVISFIADVLISHLPISIISGLVAEFMEARHLHGRTIVIDVGTVKVDGKTVGDVDRASVDPVAGWVSPVPGGVGPLTVAYLLLNVLKAQQQTKDLIAQ